MNVDGGLARIGVVTFATNVTLMFHLGEYQTTTQISLAIQSIRYQGGRTNAHLVLQYVREEMFTEVNGDRPVSITQRSILQMDMVIQCRIDEFFFQLSRALVHLTC